MATASAADGGALDFLPRDGVILGILFAVKENRLNA